MGSYMRLGGVITTVMFMLVFNLHSDYLLFI